MIEGYDELVKSLLEKEVSAPDESVQDTKRNAIASLIPMAAGVLTGQVSQGAQLGLNAYKSLEDQRSKSRGKLLDYLAKMNKKEPTDKIITKDILVGDTPETIAFNQNDLLKGEVNPLSLGKVQPKSNTMSAPVSTGAGLITRGEFAEKRARGEKVEGTPRIIVDPSSGLAYTQNVGGEAKVVGGQPKFNPVQKKALESAASETLKDPEYKISLENIDAADKAMSMLNMGSSVADAMAKFNIAKIGQSVGVLTDQDVAILAGGDKSLEGRMKQAWNNALEGKLTEENRQGYMEVLAKLREKAVERANKRVTANYGQLKSLYDIPESESLKYFSPHIQKNIPQIQSKSAIVKISDEDAKAINWAKSNRGNKTAEEILKIHGMK